MAGDDPKPPPSRPPRGSYRITERLRVADIEKYAAERLVAPPPPPPPPPEKKRSFGRLRLRSKLALILIAAALLPVAGASTIAVRLVLSGLESGVREQTARTLSVALNLVLGQVESVFEDTTRTAELPGLGDALANPQAAPAAVAALLERHALSVGVVEVADASGHVVARRAEAGRSSALLQSQDRAPAIRLALAYERRVTLERVDADGKTGGLPVLVVRALAPIVDDEFNLRGAVVHTVALDADFADRLKAELSADVVLYAGTTPCASSFVMRGGERQVGFPASATAAEMTHRGQTSIEDVAAFGHRWATGFAPLVDLEGNRIGLIGVATGAESLLDAKASAWRTLALGAFAAVVFALVLAAWASQRLTTPLGHLHAGARALAGGRLDVVFPRETSDEIGDLAEAFGGMTRSVRANQEKVAARMREIETLHRIGRAITSVLGLDEVLRKIVEEVADVLDARRCALLLSDNDGRLHVGTGVGIEGKAEIAILGEELAWRGGPVLVDDALAEPDLRSAASNAGVAGSLLAVPLEQKDRVLGLLIVNRPPDRPAFGESDRRLVATLADQAATAISNARLYDEVQRSSEELELKVKERTFELVVANQELERTLHELKSTQSQLVLSERLAGLGALVAGIAHEINSPAGAIQGAVDNLGENVSRLARRARELGDLALAPEDRTRFFALVEQLAPRLTGSRVEAPVQIRRQARELAARLEQLGVKDAERACRTLVEIGAAEAAYQLAQLGARYGIHPLVGYLEEYAYLHRSTYAIRTSIRRIVRIISALKSYSHLDQAKVAPADLHEGIENTLVILHHELKYGINVVRKFGALPQVPVYVDELNQVWTNLVHNAVQALGGKGEIVIESRVDGENVVVAVADNGPGIPAENLERIWEPFFTTKAKGEGTGLGLGIVRGIVEKHGGGIEVESRPGATRFTVRLPIAGPPALTMPAQAASA